MGDFITALTNSTTGLTASAFTAELTSLVPWLVIIVPLSFGIYEVRKSIKGAGKAKVRL